MVIESGYIIKVKDKYVRNYTTRTWDGKVYHFFKYASTPKRAKEYKNKDAAIETAKIVAKEEGLVFSSQGGGDVTVMTIEINVY